MKSKLTLLLLLIILFSMPVLGANADTNDPELLRARQCGLLTDEMMERLDEPVTYQEMCHILYGKIETYFGSEKAEAFSAAVGPGMTLDMPMYRDGGMIALFYAADAMEYHANYGEGFELREEIGEDIWNEIRWEYDGAFPNFEEAINSSVDCINPEEGWGSHPIAAFFYMLTTRSQISEQRMLDYDQAAHSFHLNQPLTCADAAKAILRLLESNQPSLQDLPPVTSQDTANGDIPELTEEKDMELQNNLQERIQNILHTETAITKSDEFIPGETYTGTAYYVSPDGSDENDGLSPETPWQSVFKVIQESNWFDRGGCLKYGDAVFFERGGLWRLPLDGDAELFLYMNQAGVTYSAYGEGDKPIITASPESGVGAEKWELYYSDESGKKIWKFYHDLSDIGAIYFNGGEKSTKRVYEILTEDNTYVSASVEEVPYDTVALVGVQIKKEDMLHSVEDSLTENLSIISRPTSQMKLDKNPYFDYDVNIPGPLYLRCDEGNPGEIFQEVEFGLFNPHGVIFVTADDVVLDNLCIKYTGNSFAKTGYDNGVVTGTIIQNCEFAYGCGTVSAYGYVTEGESQDYIGIQFDGLYNFVDATIRNNYIHDANGTAEGYEHSLDDTGTFAFRHLCIGNAFVDTMGIRLDSSSKFLKYAEQVVIDDNMVFRTGGGDTDYFKSEGALFVTDNHYKEFLVQNNVFYGTENGSDYRGLINVVADSENVSMTLNNNTFVQNSGKVLMGFIAQKLFWNVDSVSMEQIQTRMNSSTDNIYLKF